MSGAPPVVLVHGLATSSARTWGDNGWLDLLADARMPGAVWFPAKAVRERRAARVRELAPA